MKRGKKRKWLVTFFGLIKPSISLTNPSISAVLKSIMLRLCPETYFPLTSAAA
jgi:hypothetical protein